MLFLLLAILSIYCSTRVTLIVAFFVPLKTDLLSCLQSNHFGMLSYKLVRPNKVLGYWLGILIMFCILMKIEVVLSVGPLLPTLVFRTLWTLLGCLTLGSQATSSLGTNRRQGLANIQERLDRSLSSASWLQAFPDTTVANLPLVSSDHCPVLLCPMGSSLVSSKPFIFEDFWTRHASCYYVIAKAWDSVSPTNINIVSLSSENCSHPEGS